MSKKSPRVVHTPAPPTSDGVLFAAMRKHDDVQALIRKVNAIGRILEIANGTLDEDDVAGIGECLTDFAERAAAVTEESHQLVGDVWRAMEGARRAGGMR